VPRKVKPNTAFLLVLSFVSLSLFHILSVSPILKINKTKEAEMRKRKKKN
jgi:hypothetical protein